MLALPNIATAAQTTAQLTTADYARAERLLDYQLRGTLRNAVVAPHWLGQRDAFWYRSDTAQGGRYLLVDAAKGTREPAFDHERLAALLQHDFGQAKADADHLQVKDITPQGDGLQVQLTDDKQQTIRCELPAYHCERAPAEAKPGEDLLPSPDGKQAVFARDNDLWLRDLGNGHERRLTEDGQPYFAYGKLPDSITVAIPLMRSKTKIPPIGIAWSPDGKRLIGVRTDERAIAPYPFVEWVPQDGSFRPILYQLRLALLGDRGEARQDAFVIDVASGAKHALSLPADWQFEEASLSPPQLQCSKDALRCYGVATTRDSRQLSLQEIDMRSGALRRVLSEKADTPVWLNPYIYDRANLRIVGDGREAVWFSERDGWGHLYLYDIASGRLERQLTRGDWPVRDIVHVDESARQLYFTAPGHRPGDDPYLRQLYRVSLDGGDPEALTADQAEHEFNVPLLDELAVGQVGAESLFSPSGRYLVDTSSTIDQPPSSVLRASDDGHVVLPLEKADASTVYAAGWQPPARFHATASDGKTELYGVIYFPPGFDRASHASVPVIDAFYGGPQMTNVPRSFAEAAAAFNPISRASLAQLGFAVLTVDARGTPGRSRAFHDVGYGNFADPEIADHVAVIKQLGARYPALDLDRVGVYGHSFGGYTSARAILSHPEFYKVAVSSAGPHNFQGFYDGLEAQIGMPDYGHGERFRPTPQAVPEHMRQIDNSALASQLRGHLMLVYGDMDENALPAVTLQLVDALTRANKNYDLLYLPNRTHEFFRTDAYYTRRMWDYFVTHLLHAQPPEDYTIQPPKAAAAP